MFRGFIWLGNIRTQCHVSVTRWIDLIRAVWPRFGINYYFILHAVYSCCSIMHDNYTVKAFSNLHRIRYGLFVEQRFEISK